MQMIFCWYFSGPADLGFAVTCVTSQVQPDAATREPDRLPGGGQGVQSSLGVLFDPRCCATPTSWGPFHANSLPEDTVCFSPEGRGPAEGTR